MDFYAAERRSAPIYKFTVSIKEGRCEDGIFKIKKQIDSEIQRPTGNWLNKVKAIGNGLNRWRVRTFKRNDLACRLNLPFRAVDCKIEKKATLARFIAQ